jgi:Rod binding domain-containing protein
MTPVSLLPTGASVTEKPKDSPEKILDAARQFESLLIEQVLHAMRDSAQAAGPDKDSSTDSLMEFAEQEFAKVMSAGGGFGLSRTIVDGLRNSVRRPS